MERLTKADKDGLVSLKEIRKIVFALIDEYEDWHSGLLNDSYDLGYNNGYHDALADVLHTIKKQQN